MTDAEAIGKAVIEKKQIEEALRVLRIKADRYAEVCLALGHLLKDDPAGIVFDEQVSRVGVGRAHFNSKDCDIAAVKELVGQIRTHQDRLSDLTSMLG